eukprot:GILJ01002929.1.p1 GENE.GILJ01002929.1~~GILJ01002929.1.p1  ORF type:complete len:185 (+),score=12.97 GILJ01002929.1:48-602(+)
MLSGLRDLFYSLLSKLGFLNKNASIVLLGLDNAGKTTLLYKLKTNKMLTFVPTQRAKEEEFTVGSVTFRAWDLGGHQPVRSLWHDYFQEADGVVWVLDAADAERLDEAKQELHQLLTLDEAEKVPVVILANKSDLKMAKSPEELLHYLELMPFFEQGRRLQIFRTSLVDSIGYLDGIRWLADQI